MGMIEAALPTMPAVGLAMGANQVAAVPQGLVTEGAVQGVAIKSAAAGLLFGMLMTQLAAGMSQPATEKETDAKASKGSETPQQSSPDQMSILASLVPLLVSVSIEPQPSNPAAAGTTNAVSNGGATLTPLALATLAVPRATSPSADPALSMLDSIPAEPQPSNPAAAGTTNAVSGGEVILPPVAPATVGAHPDFSMGPGGPGKILEAALVENQVPVAVDTQAGTLPLISIHAHGQR